jgi:hypothetical protein
MAVNHLGKRPVAIQSRRNRIILAVVAVLLLALAWYDGGERPLHEVVEPVAVPGAGQ